MIHELIDPKKKTNRTRSSRNAKSLIPTKFTLENTSVEGSENSNKDSSSTIFISPWIRNSFGGKQKNKLSRSTVSPTDLKPIKISLGNSYQSDADSFKANVEDDFYAKAPTHLELFRQDNTHELRCSQESEEVRVFDFSYNDSSHTSGETSRKNCASTEERPVKNENVGLATSNIVNGDIARNLKIMRQKNKPRRRLPVTSRPAEATENDIEMEIKARKALDSYMKAVNRSASSGGKLEARETEKSKVQDINNQIPNEGKGIPITEGVTEILLGNIDGVHEGEVVEEETELSEKVSKDSKEIFVEHDKNKKENLEEIKKPTKEVRQKIETPKGPPMTMEEDRENKLTEFLSGDKEEEDEETKCLEEVKKFLERKKRTRQTKHRFYQASPSIPEPQVQEEVHREKLKLYRVKGSNIVPCSENVVGKAVDEALQKFVEIYHFHVSHGVMESMKKDIMRALTTESETNSCTKLSKDEKNISNFSELEEKDFDIFKNGQFTAKEPSSGDLNPCKELINKYSSSSSLRKEFETFLNFIRTHIDVSNLKVRNIILEEKDKKDSSERLQFVCNFAKKEVLRVRQHKQETQTAESLHKKNIKFQSLGSKEATCDKNLQTVVHEQTQTIPEPLPIKKSVKLQVFESKSLITCEKSQETEKINYYIRATQTEQQTISEIKSLRRCNVKPGVYKLIKSKEAGKFFLYQEHNEASQEILRAISEGSVVKDKKYSTELRSQPSKERTRERNVFFEGKEKIKKKKKNKQKKKKPEDGKKDSIDYLYFRNFDKRGSDLSMSKNDEDMSDGKTPAIQHQNTHEERSGTCWLWDGERISHGCDLKNQVENLVVEKLTQMCSMWYNANEMALNTANPPKEGEETLHRTISERTFDVASFKDMEEQSPTKAEEKWTSKKEENNEGQDVLYYSRENSVKSVETANVDWKFVSQYLPRLRNFGRKCGSRRKHSRRNSVLPSQSTSQRLNRLREAGELLLTVEKLKEIHLNVKNDNFSEGDTTQNDSTSTSENKTASVEVPIVSINNAEIQQFPDSECQRKWDKTIALTGNEPGEPENFYDLNVSKNQANEPETDRRKQMEMIGNVFSKIKRHEKENLWRDIRKFIKKKLGRDLNSADNPGEVCIEIEQDIPENKEGMNPSLMGNNSCAQFEGEFEVEVDLTLEDLEQILNRRRKKMKRRSCYRNRRLKSSSSTHSENKDNLDRYQRYHNRFPVTGTELVEQSSKAF